MTIHGTVGDFDGDGFPDLVLNTHSLTEPIGLHFLRGLGDGTFAMPVQVLSGCCASVAAGDFNGDSRLDLVLQTGEAEGVLLGNGDGTFGNIVLTPARVFSPRPPLVVDLNGDGKMDLAAASQFGGISLLLGNGDGTFGTAADFPIGGGYVANALTAGDFDGNGIPDIAASNPGPPDDFEGTNVSILLGVGDGTFGPPLDFTVGRYPFPIVTADFNRDSALDIAVANYGAASVSVLLGEGNGSFEPKLDAADGAFPVGLGAADFNLDGKPDVVSVYLPVASAFSVFLNTTPSDITVPTVTASADPSILEPPSGRMARVTLTGTITDAESGVDLTSAMFVVEDEYGAVQPSGSIEVNADGSYRVQILLEASRKGTDFDGRTYRVTVSVSDQAGNRGSADVVVRVPHHRGG